MPVPSGTPGNLKVLDWAGFKSALTYTFDDAQPSQIEHYAELQATGVRLTFYITTGSSSGERLRRDVLAGGARRPRDGQPHRAPLPRRSDRLQQRLRDQLDAELDDCTSYITGHFGQSAVWTAASPFGDTGYDTPDMTRFFLNRGVGAARSPPTTTPTPSTCPATPRPTARPPPASTARSTAPTRPAGG